MQTKSYNRREWLNPAGHYSSGAIQWGASQDDYGVCLTLDIWDCSRKIQLELDYYDKESRHRTILKLEKLEKAIQDLLWTARALEHETKES